MWIVDAYHLKYKSWKYNSVWEIGDRTYVLPQLEFLLEKEHRLVVHITNPVPNNLTLKRKIIVFFLDIFKTHPTPSH